MAKNDNTSGNGKKSTTAKGKAESELTPTPAPIPLTPEEVDVNPAFVPEVTQDRGPVQTEPEQGITAIAETSEDTVEDSTKADEEPSWPLDVWHDVALEKIGTPTHVITAAMADEDQDAEYTEPQVRRLVEKFLNRPAR